LNPIILSGTTIYSAQLPICPDENTSSPFLNFDTFEPISTPT